MTEEQLAAAEAEEARGREVVTYEVACDTLTYNGQQYVEGDKIELSVANAAHLGGRIKRVAPEAKSKAVKAPDQPAKKTDDASEGKAAK